MNFEGFVPPTKNYFPMPNEWIDICSEIRDISELKVIQYVIRHTWGFHEYGICKTISVDEFMQGRRRQDGTRMDKGTGLSEQSVRNGLKKAINDGYLLCETDPSDAGRIKKSYALKMRSDGQVQTLDPPQTLDPVPGTNFRPQGTKPYTSDSQSLDPRVPEFIPRTEKDTIERHLEKDTLERQESLAPTTLSETDSHSHGGYTNQPISLANHPRRITGEHPAITQEMLAEKVIAPKITLPSKQTPPPQSQVSGPPDVQAPPASVASTAQAGAPANRRGSSNHRPVRIEKPQLTLQGEQARTYYEQVRGKKLRMTDNNVKACNSLGENEDTTFENLRDTINYLDNHELVIERGLVVDMQSLARDDYYFNFERSLTIVERNRKARKKPSQKANELPEFTEEEYQRLKETPA